MLNKIDAKRPTILIFTGHYLPGVKGGGPIRTLASMVEALGSEFSFKIITTDRDLGSCEPYPAIQENTWQQQGRAEVFYLSPERLNWFFLRRVIKNMPHDILYVNGFFSPYFSITPLLLRWMSMIPRKPVIVAPRGGFSRGALNLKKFKKKAFIYFSKALHVHEHTVWQVSSAYEKEDLLRIFGPRKGDPGKRILIAKNLTNIKPSEISSKTPDKKPGTLKIAFLSRISPMKNLDGAIKMLKGVTGDIVFNVFGPPEDLAYWEKCRQAMAQLPDHIKVHYKGMIDHEDVIQTLSAHNLFFLPTHGENFGHVIIEALIAGCPVLISDQTPWRHLEKLGVGWDIPLDQPEQFTKVLQYCTDMNHQEMTTLSMRASDHGRLKALDPATVQQNRDLFLNTLQMSLF